MKALIISSFALLSFFLALTFYPAWDKTPIPAYFGEKLFLMQQAKEYALFSKELLLQPQAEEIPVPVIGVRERDIADTFGALRSGGRDHDGVDIFARRGAHIVSATDGIVLRIGIGNLGGNYVFVLGPAGERYYYAHLDQIDAALREGQVVSEYTILGTVGNTGNATSTDPHLHFGIYGRGGALNPLDRF